MKVDSCFGVFGHKYAAGYAGTYFSVPACTRHRGKRIVIYFTNRENGVVFCPMDTHKHLLPVKGLQP